MVGKLVAMFCSITILLYSCFIETTTGEMVSMGQNVICIVQRLILTHILAQIKSLDVDFSIVMTTMATTTITVEREIGKNAKNSRNRSLSSYHLVFRKPWNLRA